MQHPITGWDWEKGQGRPFYYYACGAAVSEVEVDGYTGMHRVLRVDILHDVGSSLNPGIDRGQIEGGFVQGMGWLTREELVWDKEGRLQTHSASTYQIPAVSDAPAGVPRDAASHGRAGGHDPRQQGGGRAAADAGHLRPRSHPGCRCGLRASRRAGAAGVPFDVGGDLHVGAGATGGERGPSEAR